MSSILTRQQFLVGAKESGIQVSICLSSCVTFSKLINFSEPSVVRIISDNTCKSSEHTQCLAHNVNAR